MNGYDVVVIGGGCAGLSAGVRLARGGARVLVLEGKARLGGRATSFDDRDSGEVVDNGQHVLLGCYTETLEFLHDIGAAGDVRVQPQLAVTMIDRLGRRSRLTCPALPSPLHLLAGVLEWDALKWRDRLAVLGMATPIRLARKTLRPGSTLQAASSGETVENWLIRNGQTQPIREMLWNPLALAALNQPPEQAAAPAFARVLAEMFGTDPKAAAVVLAGKPLEALYGEPAKRFIQARGGEVRTGAAARVRVEGDAVVAVDAAGTTWPAALVVSAVPWFALAELFESIPPALAPTVDRAGHMAASPIVTVNLWFGARVLDEPFVGLPGRTMQWVFDKSLIFGEPTSHLSTVSSGAASIVGQSNDALIALALDELSAALPRVRSARLVRATVVREPRATFSLAPGQPQRPPSETPIRGFFLAGDWIDTGLPATIESAVRSGHRAAALCAE